MVQSGTYLNVVDNTGAKIACCIKVIGGYRKRYASVGDIICVSVKSLRARRDLNLKVKKGEVLKAVVVRTKCSTRTYCNDSFSFFENAVVLINAQNKLLGSRVFGLIPKSFRFTKFLKILSISSGSC